MEHSYSSPTRPKEPHDNDKPCVDCDLGDFDTLNCDVEGITAEADYMKQHQGPLKQRRELFDDTRTAYETARRDVTADLEIVTKQLKRIRDQVECQISKDRRECLDRAWRQVKKRLDACGGEQGCCVTEEQCQFDWDLGEGPTAPAIRAVIEDFDRRVTYAEKCFDDVLVKEPQELKNRASSLKTDVEALSGTASDTKTTDYEYVYARLIWLEHRRRKVWLGFDTVSDYVDCLCLALNCSLQGRRALAKLTGMLKIIECRELRTVERCNTLKQHVVEEIIAACRRICPPDQPHGRDTPEQQA